MEKRFGYIYIEIQATHFTSNDFSPKIVPFTR